MSLLIFCVKIILHSNCVLQSLCSSWIFTKSHCILYSLLSSRGLIKQGQQYWGSAPGNCQSYSIPCSIQSYWALKVLWHEMGGSWSWILPIVLNLSCIQSIAKSANLTIALYVKNWIIWNAFSNGWCVHWCIMAECFFSRPFDLLLQSHWLW